MPRAKIDAADDQSDAKSDVIIVGGGASGVLLAYHLVRHAAAALKVTLIEQRGEVGRGLAYFTTNPDHLLNVRAANMSALPDQPDHFWQWLCARDDDGTGSWRNCGDPFCFVPRRIYGDYIASLIAPLVSDGKSGGRLRVIRGQCVDVSAAPSGVDVALADGSRLHADFAVLATGHEAAGALEHFPEKWPPVFRKKMRESEKARPHSGSTETECGLSGPFVDPWTAPREAGVGRDERVLILGTGLSMIDYVLSLVLAGHRGPIVAMSRHGLLPHGHRRVQPLAIEESEVPFGAGAASLLRWLRVRIDEHAARGGDWRSVVDGIRPYTQGIWRSLPLAARRSFLEHARAFWDVRRHRMAPEVERRIEGELSSGRLTVIAARLKGIETDATNAVIRYRRRGASAIETLHVDKIADCRGVAPAPLKIVNPALRSLVDRGLARLDPLAIGLDMTDACAIIDRAGVPSERLFAVGALTRAAFWEIIAIPDIRSQCVELADRIIRAKIRTAG
jgi:uncharacterized NAD(P)/FAD-binding protein YdhS